jgi:hypothetical protein
VEDSESVQRIGEERGMAGHGSAVNNIRDKLGMITGGKNAYAQLRSGEKIDWGK